MSSPNPRLDPCGRLIGHGDWVTAISTPAEVNNNTLVSGSRDKKVMVWKLNDNLRSQGSFMMDESPGVAYKALTGHGQCVQDVVMSQDGHFALSGSWDKTIRLWDLNTGRTVRRFVKHTSDVNSVAFSADNRQIVSGSRDKTIRLWNTLAECKYTIDQDQHTEWVSRVGFCPTSTSTPTIVSTGWDKIVKVWNLPDCKLRTNLVGHTGPIYSLTISPDGSLCASGGKDSVVMLWDVAEGRHLYSLEAGGPVHSLAFSPCHYWLTGVAGRFIKVWDLQKKNVLAEIDVPEALDSAKQKKTDRAWCVSLAWSSDGNVLFAGAVDGSIYVYKLMNYGVSVGPDMGYGS